MCPVCSTPRSRPTRAAVARSGLTGSRTRRPSMRWAYRSRGDRAGARVRPCALIPRGCGSAARGARRGRPGPAVLGVRATSANGPLLVAQAGARDCATPLGRRDGAGRAHAPRPGARARRPRRGRVGVPAPTAGPLRNRGCNAGAASGRWATRHARPRRNTGEHGRCCPQRPRRRPASAALGTHHIDDPRVTIEGDAGAARAVLALPLVP